MCFGGDDGKAARKAEQMEVDRQKRIGRNVADINSAFRGREPQYADFAAALREQYNNALTRMRTDNVRQGKFALARSGLTGGSAAIDLGREQAREAQEGVLTAEREVQGKVAGLRGQDEASRLSMISLAQSGSDIGNAASQTANALRSNIEGAKNVNVVDSLGNVFGGTADIYRKSQEAAARRRGLKEATVYANPFTRGT